jgi:ATP-binding cassette subfamily F protein 3
VLVPEPSAPYPTTAVTPALPGQAARGGARRDRAAKRASLAPLKGEAKRVEAKLATLEAERSQLRATLADPALYAGQRSADIPALTRRQAQLDEEIAGLEEAWLAAHEALEAAARA